MDSKKLKDRSQYKHFTIRFLYRSIRFLSVSIFVLFIFYVFSNSQDFLDSSLFVILNVLMSLCILLIIFTFVSIILNVFFLIRDRDLKYLLRFIVAFVLFWLSIVLAVLFSFIMVIARGNI